MISNTQIEGYYEIDGSIKVLDKELQGHGYGANENQVKLGQQTFYKKLFRNKGQKSTVKVKKG